MHPILSFWGFTCDKELVLVTHNSLFATRCGGWVSPRRATHTAEACLQSNKSTLYTLNPLSHQTSQRARGPRGKTTPFRVLYRENIVPSVRCDTYPRIVHTYIYAPERRRRLLYRLHSVGFGWHSKSNHAVTRKSTLMILSHAYPIIYDSSSQIITK